jgi:hypothetical protein
MLWLWVLFALLLLLIVVVLASNIDIRFTLSRQGENDEGTIDIKALFGLVRYRLAIPFVKFVNFDRGVEIKLKAVNRNQNDLLSEGLPNITGEKIKHAFEDVMEILRHTFQFNEWLTRMLAHVRCTKFEWSSIIGVGEAPETAITTGMVWGLKSSLLGFAFRYIRLEAQPRLFVTPNFNQMEFTSVARGLLHVRVWHIAVSMVSLLIRVLKVKGGLKVWQGIVSKVIHNRPAAE